MEVLGTAGDGFEALEKARSLRPEVILMDIQMPRCNGLTATRLIKAEQPGIKIVMLTMSSDDDDLFEAIKSGASGYLLKTQDTEDFFNGLMELSRGEAPLSPGLAAKLLGEFTRMRKERHGERETRGEGDTGRGGHGEMEKVQLTERQGQVLALVAQGLTYKEVAAKLCLSERTIKYHMGEIIARLHLENRAQVIEFARRSGLVK